MTELTNTKTEELMAEIPITPSEELRLLSWAKEDELCDQALTTLIVATEMSKAADTNSQVLHELVTAKRRVQVLLDNNSVDQATITHIQGLMEAIALPAKLAVTGRFEVENFEST